MLRNSYSDKVSVEKLTKTFEDSRNSLKTKVKASQEDALLKSVAQLEKEIKEINNQIRTQDVNSDEYKLNPYNCGLMLRISAVLRSYPHLTGVVLGNDMLTDNQSEKISFSKWLVQDYCTASLESTLHT